MSTISARILKVLAEQIIDGTLHPGEKLEERSLAAQFEASRTPVREALRELAARGLVEIKPRSGVVVASIGAERLAALLEAESELEALCARRAAECMTPMEKNELESLLERCEQFAAAGDEENYLRANQQLHAMIHTGSRNKVLSQMVAEMRDRLGPFRQAQKSVANRLPTSHREHRTIVDAILNGNGERAYLAMRNHNNRLMTTVIQLVRQQVAEKLPLV